MHFAGTFLGAVLGLISLGVLTPSALAQFSTRTAIPTDGPGAASSIVADALTSQAAEDRARRLIELQLGVTNGLDLLQLSTDDFNLFDGTSSDWRLYFQRGSEGRVDGNSIGSTWETITTNPVYRPPTGTPFVPAVHVQSSEAAQIALNEPGVIQFLSDHQIDKVLANGGMPQNWHGGPSNLALWEFIILGQHSGPEAPPSYAVTLNMETGEVLLALAVGVEDSPSRPEGPEIRDVYPNPFPGAATVSIAQPADGWVIAEVFDVMGRRVDRILDGWHPAGSQDVRWQAGDLAPGAYFLRLTSPAGSTVQTVVKRR